MYPNESETTMESFNYSDSDFFFLLGGPAGDSEPQEHLLSNPLDDGMADIKAMYKSSDIAHSIEGTVFNHNTEKSTPATGFIMNNDLVGPCLLVLTNENNAYGTGSWVYYQKLSTSRVSETLAELQD